MEFFRHGCFKIASFEVDLSSHDSVICVFRGFFLLDSFVVGGFLLLAWLSSQIIHHFMYFPSIRAILFFWWPISRSLDLYRWFDFWYHLCASCYLVEIIAWYLDLVYGANYDQQGQGLNSNDTHLMTTFLAVWGFAGSRKTVWWLCAVYSNKFSFATPSKISSKYQCRFCWLMKLSLMINVGNS